MDSAGVDSLLRLQQGVVSRRQILEHGGTDSDIERLRRRGRLAPVHHGVYVDHTGPLTWEQRAWAAILRHAPAALAGESALLAHKVRGPWQSRSDGSAQRSAVNPIQNQGPNPVQVLVASERHLRRVPGIVVQRTTHFDRIARLDLSPPRVALEHAVLDAASCARDEAAAIALLGDICQERRTTVARLLDALDLRPRLPRRKLMLEVLADVETGAYSVLERRYLREVEQAHQLPAPHRQRKERVVVDQQEPLNARPSSPTAYRDVDYDAFGLLVELDGRLGHEWTTDRWADMDRDVLAAIGNRLTIRPGWKQILQPCRLARMVTLILRARGWTGSPVVCGPTCRIGVGFELGAEPAPTADNAPSFASSGDASSGDASSGDASPGDASPGDASP